MPLAARVVFVSVRPEEAELPDPTAITGASFVPVTVTITVRSWWAATVFESVARTV